MEKRDPSNVIPMCKFGCDDLFERDYISISHGRIEVNSQKVTTQTVAEYVRPLSGRQCKYRNEANAQYFAWRKEHTVVLPAKTGQVVSV